MTPFNVKIHCKTSIFLGFECFIRQKRHKKTEPLKVQQFGSGNFYVGDLYGIRTHECHRERVVS